VPSLPPDLVGLWLCVLIGIGTYLAAVAIGRWLKKRAGVPLGIFYQLFCLALAGYVALAVRDDVTPAPTPGRPAAVAPATAPAKPAEGKDQFEGFNARRELAAASVLFGSVFFVALMRRFLFDHYFRHIRKTEVPKFLADLIAVLVFIFAGLFVFGILYQRSMTGLLAGSGILTLILGIAMQDLLGNILSGIALEVSKPFKIGDWLIVENQHAQVIEVNWRSTRLRTNDDVYFDIPNKQIVGQTVTNLSYPTREHAMRLTIGVDYDAPPTKVKEVLARAARNGRHVLKNPAPRVFLKDFADFAVLYEVKFWMDNHQLYNDVLDSIRTNIWYEFRRAHINIPYPIQIERHEATPAPPDLSGQVRSCLSRQPIFRELTPVQMSRLTDGVQLTRYGAGEDLIQQGAQGSSMFVLVSGLADVSVEKDGSRTRVANLEAGECFGEMSLLTGEPRTATVTARTDCEVIEIGKEVFGSLLEGSPDLLTKLSELLAERRMETEGVLANNAEEQVRTSRQREYTESFFAKLRSFFEL
jgi:small-conductance mechanosensitive channel/CRP-like cAMP-binding protein